MPGTSCLIDRGADFNCAEPNQGGVKREFIAINLDDWLNATVTVDTGVTEKITNIVLASTKEGYKFVTPKAGQNIIDNTALRPVDGVDGYDHSLDVRVSSNSQLERDNISKTRWTKVVVVLPLLNGEMKLFGGHIDSDGNPVGVGMRLSDLQENNSDAATGGTTQFVWKTPDDDPAEAKLPHIIASSFDYTTLETPAA